MEEDLFFDYKEDADKIDVDIEEEEEEDWLSMMPDVVPDKLLNRPDSVRMSRMAELSGIMGQPEPSGMLEVTDLEDGPTKIRDQPGPSWRPDPPMATEIPGPSWRPDPTSPVTERTKKEEKSATEWPPAPPLKLEESKLSKQAGRSKIKVTANPGEVEPISESTRKEMSADITCEFLEVAFHQILFHRGLYPKAAFSMRKKYHIPVHMCMHPGLTKYIRDILKSLKPLIEQDTVQKVVLSILCNEKPSEKFVFELNTVDRDTCRERRDDFLMSTELSLRESLLKISSYAAPLPNMYESRFEVLAHAGEGAALGLLCDEESELYWVREDEGPHTKPQRLIPLKTIKNSPVVQMQIFVLQQS